MDLLKAVIQAGVITIPALRKAYQETDMSEREMFKAGRLLRKLETECESGYGAALGTPPVGRESRAKYGRANPDSVVRKSSRAKNSILN
ncbi:MAG: hypothetical protein WCI20_15170 [bacterium]